MITNLLSILKRLIAAHPSIKDMGEKRRAQLLSSFTLAVIGFIVFAIAVDAQRFGPLSTLVGFLFVLYLISRSKYHGVAAYISVYIIVIAGIVRIYQGTAISVETAIFTSSLVSLIIASALLSQFGYLLLFAISTIAAFATPYYSHIPPNGIDNNYRTGLIVVFVGALLYSINYFREAVDRARLENLRNTNIELTELELSLEKRVAERTAELQNANQQIELRAAKLLTVSAISQSITADVEKKLSELLMEITQLISERTGYYHVGIFLLDENREYAILQAANSEGGQRMLARHHQLRVGGTGIVGYVSQGGRARIALDTGVDAVFFNNPDLPETRSEMALPLKVGSRVIGVLDVQSKQSTAFNEEDIAVLGTLANQVAIVIQNALIMENPDTAANKKRSSNVVLNRERQKGLSYFPDGTIAALELQESPTVTRALSTGETVVQEQSQSSNAASKLAVPVKLRDNVIGVIHVEASQNNRKWTDDEIALIQSVSERAALALENARLFEETEKLAEQERLVGQITSQIGASKNMENILHTTIQELGRTLGASRTFIQLETPSSSNRINSQGQNNE